jgi:hypothetical protein
MCLAIEMVAHAGLFSADAPANAVLVGATSADSAIVVAHELIHRESRAMQLLGRVLLWTVMSDHFFTEHVRGHHAHVATEDDPATSRFGETYGELWKRTAPGQLRSAFRIEARRLGDEEMRWVDRRSLRSAVVHGIAAEVALSRHADHPAHAARPYQSLRPWAESPKLPRGYVGMVVLVLFRNAEARRLLEAELRRTKLGPFAEAA